MIPRGFELLDYTLGGGAGDRGAPDIVHGEGGDDVVHGMTGNDILFGEGQDDDLYGGLGSDRIYGGVGQDGVLGDDGKIQTSRNGLTESLHGLNSPNLETTLSISGPFDDTTIYVSGELHKSVTLAEHTVGGEDIIYGGLGDDFLHGGAGNDGISGAEATVDFYNEDPQSNSLPIVYDPVTRNFDAYDPNFPLRRINGFFLNFDAEDALGNGNKINDGNDVIFGDHDHDWLVGGTNDDHIFGGRGDDLINLDDNLDTNGGNNNTADNNEFDESDRVYGGAGLDVMLANSQSDQMFDWVGEFNSYVVPFSPFGPQTDNRAATPQIVDYITQLGIGSGLDQSLVEPDGELGLFTQSDADWGDNLGAPNDPQPGNNGGNGNGN